MNGKSKFNVEEANTLANYIGLSDKEKVDIFLNWNLRRTQVYDK